MGKSGISGRFFFSVGLGPVRIGTSSGGVLDGITGEGLVWFALFVFVGMPILAALFEAFFFIVFVLLISLVLVAVSFLIFEFAITRTVERGVRVGGASSILTPLGGVMLGIPTATIYLLCLYRIPLVGRDWDYPNRIENCSTWLDTNVCEYTNIYGFAHIGWWIMALGACTAYMLIACAVGFALRKKWIPIAEQAWHMRQYQAFEALVGRKGANPFKGGASFYVQLTLESLSRPQSPTHLEPDAEEIRQWLLDNPCGEVIKTTPLRKRIEMAERRRDVRRRGGTPRWSDYPDWAWHRLAKPITPRHEQKRLRKIRKAKSLIGQPLPMEDFPVYKFWPNLDRFKEYGFTSRNEMWFYLQRAQKEKRNEVFLQLLESANREAKEARKLEN